MFVILLKNKNWYSYVIMNIGKKKLIQEEIKGTQQKE